MARKTSWIFILTLLLVGALKAQPNSILGDWVQATPQATWSFRADGSGIMERGQPAGTARFNWRIEGGVLKLSTAVGTPVVYQIMESPPNELVIVNRRLGVEYRLKRK